MVTIMDKTTIHKTSSDLSNLLFEYINVNVFFNHILVTLISGSKTNNLTLGEDIFFLISNDADHYGKDFDNDRYGLDLQAHTKGTENDVRIMGEYLNGKVSQNEIDLLASEIISNGTNDKQIPIWCGRYPIVLGMNTLYKLVSLMNKSMQSEPLLYSDSFTEKMLPFRNSVMGLTAPFSLEHWVGFFSNGFFC